MNDVLEHIPKEVIVKALELVHKSLRKGGIFIVKVPNMANPFGLYSRYIDITHETGFTEYSLHEVLNVAGFDNISIHPTISSIGGIKGYFWKIAKVIIYSSIKFLYLAQGYTIPRYLTPNIIGIAKKLM